MKKYILLLFLELTFTLKAQPDIAICVPLAAQEQDWWCTVAASQCVLLYFGPYVQQCKIMDYVRTETLSYGVADCCVDPNQGCNTWGVPLYGGKGTAQTILSHFGEINSVAHQGPPPEPDRIGAYLRNDRPLIISLEYKVTLDQHAVVVYGKDVGIGKDLIYFMDPAPVNEGKWDKKKYNDLLFGWNNIPFKWLNTLVIGDALYPDHCFNGRCDEDKGETDVDCGGLCQPCQAPPPPPNTCFNCILDPGEVQIDCGGPNCPPCEDLPEEIIITNTDQLRTEMMAFNKITANGYVRVKSEQNISFITSDTGSIVLLPGFKAERGSNFSVYMKDDISEYSRICPENLCTTASFPNQLTVLLPYGKWFGIYNLLYAVKIEYEIYDKKGRFIYGEVKNVTHNGSVGLWDCKTGAIIMQGAVTYNINCTVHYCNGVKHNYTHTFVVKYLSKSSTEDPEETENPPQFSPLNLSDTPFPSVTAPPNFSIIPNPNNGTFQIETNFPLSEISNLKISNLIGTTIYETQHVTEQPIQLPNSALGMFFVVIILKDGAVLTQKMVVQ